MDFIQAQYESDLQMIELCGKDVIYRRGEKAVRWRAIPGNSEFSMTDTNGVLTTFESADFIGQADLLVFDEEPTAGPITPERGDRIWRIVRNATLVYEVLPPNIAPCYKYSDPDHLIIRIHTKIID
jgi:hypothetical protein